MSRFLTPLILLLFFFSSCEEKKESDKSTSITHMEDSNELLFVGTYTRDEGHVNGKADGIYALNFNSKTGQLSAGKLKTQIINPSYLSVDKQNQRVYAVSEIAGEEPNGGGKIKSFSYDAKNGKMTEISSVDAYGGAPCYIMHHENHLFSANYVGGNFVVHKLDEDGGIIEMTQFIQNKGKGTTSRQEAPHAHMITRNPLNGYFYAVDLGTDQINVYSFDKKKGHLHDVMQVNSEPGSGPRHLAFHPDKDIFYAVNELSGSVDVFVGNEGSYALLQNIHSTINPNNQDAGCADIHIHPNGKFLYASNRGDFNSIMIYKIAEDGSLTIVSEKMTGGLIPRSFTIDPSGKFLLVAHQNSDNIMVFDIEQESGRLLEKGIEFEAPTPVCLKFVI